MATLCSIATGNLTSSTTWALVDTTSYQAGENSAQAVTTSYVNSSTFTPGAITIDAVGVKLAVRSGTTGTISIAVQQGGATVSGTEVTIDCADLPAAVTANSDGGWIVFKMAAPVSLLAATAYTIAAKTSSASQVSLFRDGTTNNWARFLRTTTQQAPVAGDDMIIAGEHTGSGTGNDFTITMNSTAATDYGSAPSAANSAITPGLAICKRGTLTYGSSAATNYIMRLSNSAIVYLGGALNIGTTGTPIPRNSTALLEFDCAADGDYGLLMRAGTSVIQGLSRTSGKNVVKCKLSANAAASATSLTVDTDTGWLDNDEIALAPTNQTATQFEKGTLNGDAGASTLTVDGFAGSGGGILNARSGTSPTQGHAGLLTRNVRIRSVSLTAMSYVYVGPAAAVDIDWAQFSYLGENATNKRGIEIATTTGSFDMRFSSLHDVEDGGWYLVGSTVNNVTVVSCIGYNLANAALAGWTVASATTGTAITSEDVLIIGTGAGAAGWLLSDNGMTITNCIAGGVRGVGLLFAESAAIGTVNGFECYSGGDLGIIFNGSWISGTLSNVKIWRSSNNGIRLSVGYGVIFDGLEMFGNGTANIIVQGSGRFRIKSGTISGDTTFGVARGIIFSSAGTAGELLLDDCSFGVATGIKTAHTTADIDFDQRTSYSVIMRNTALGSTVEVNNQANLLLDGSLQTAAISGKHDQTAGNHKAWLKYGTLTSDTSIFNAASPSMRLTPGNASFKLQSAPHGGGIKAAAASGSAATFSVNVRKSVSGDGAAYNGNQPRLIVRANPAIGISSDAVLATASAAAGSWELLSGTTASFTDDGVAEVIVDCDGTAGWVNIDDWSAS